MSNDERPQGPGLKWRDRRHGDPVPYWFASPKAIAAGYPVKSANLSQFADRPAELIARCERLQTEMDLWLNKVPRIRTEFDGTFATLLSIYETDEESKFHGLKPRVKNSYAVYLPRLKEHIGELRIDQADGADVKRWFRQWRTGKRDMLPRARFILSVLKAATSFGVMRRLKGVAEFQAAMAEAEFQAVPPRTFAPTEKQVAAARKAAHEAGQPHRALVYALQFETTLRPWDIIGSWVEMSDPRPSLVHARGRKWIGPMWAAIDEHQIMRVKPTKTEDTTGVYVAFDLAVCPMVQEDLARIPEDKRNGPLIVDNKTGRPFPLPTWHEGWRADFKAAGLPKGMWNRDIRAGGVTAGRKAGAGKDDLRKLAGHAREETTDIYDRDMIEAHRRVMAARNKA